MPRLFWFRRLHEPRRNCRRARHPQPTCKPVLESLEDRLAPAVLTVNTTCDDPAQAITSALTLRDAIALVNQGGDPTSLGQASMPAAWAAQIDTSAGPFGSGDTIKFNIPWNDPGHVYYRDDGVAGQLSPVNVAVVPSNTTSDADLANPSLVGAGNTIDPDWAHSWWSIQLTGAGLGVVRPTVIDGYSQSGACCNTLATGDNAVLRISIDGSRIAGGPGLASLCILALGDGSTVRGLDLRNSGFSAIYLTSSNDQVAGDFLGVDPSGTVADATADVVDYAVLTTANTHNVTIGGSTPAARNVVLGARLEIEYSSGVRIEGNYIGTDPSGTRAPDPDPGVLGVTLEDTTNCSVVNNLISGNTDSNGILMYTDPGIGGGNRVAGNLIGTDATGTRPLPNGTGIQVWNGTNDTIGGTSAVDANVVAFNDGPGIDVVSGTGESVEGNSVHDNAGVGVWLEADPFGKDDLNSPVNGGRASGVRVERNSIYGDGGLGIALGSLALDVNGQPTNDPNAWVGTGPSGVLLNDSQGHDGANNDQNFPLLAAAQSGSSVLVSGRLSSAACTQYTVDVYANDPSTLHSSLFYQGQYYGEGQYYLGSATVTTDGSGNVTFAAAFSAANLPGGVLPDGWSVSATATDPGGNTSEFGPDVQATSGNALQSVLTSGATVNVQAATTDEVNTVLSAVSQLSANTSGTLSLNLSGFTKYGSETVSAPQDLTVFLNGDPVSAVPTTVDPAVPALVVTSGKVIVSNVTFTESGDAPTILVTGGSLTLRHDVIQESTGFNDAAISITGGTVDLGTAADPGGNTINVNGAGTFIRNTTANPVSAVGDTFEITGQATPWPVPLAVKSSSSLMLVGNSPPPLSGSVNGVPFTGTVTYTTPFGDQVTVTLGTAATSASPVGQYAITPSLSGPDAGNYILGPEASAAGTMYVVSLGADPSSTIAAQAVTFWDNKGNTKLITAADLSSLDALNLVNQGGAAFDPHSVAQLQAWLSVSPNATAAYQLAVQLAVADLNVLAGYVHATDLVYAAALLPFASAYPIPGLTAGGFIDVQNLMTAANAALAQVGPGTPSGDPNQAYEAALAQVLRMADSNSDFVTQELLWGLLGTFV
jgi:hypothetical protein